MLTYILLILYYNSVFAEVKNLFHSSHILLST